MDGITVTLPEVLKKYRIVILVLFLGIALLVIPEKKTKEPTQSPVIQPVIQTENSSLEESLSYILSQIHGAGKVEVLLTQAAGERITYQTDEDISGTDTRRNTVLITGSDREETGLVRQVLPPVYQGAIVVCQGADSAQIRLAVVEAVMCVTGLSSDRISVLKMK